MADYEFDIQQGCDVEEILELVQNDGVTPFPLTAYSSAICDFGDAGTLVKCGSFTAVITSGVNGTVKLTLTSAITDTLTPDKKYSAQLRALTSAVPPVKAHLLDIEFTVKGEMR